MVQILKKEFFREILLSHEQDFEEDDDHQQWHCSSNNDKTRTLQTELKTKKIKRAKIKGLVVTIRKQN